MEVAKDLFFHTVKYIRLKRIIIGKQMLGWAWFDPLGVDWMEADLNVSLQLILRKACDFS